VHSVKQDTSSSIILRELEEYCSQWWVEHMACLGPGLQRVQYVMGVHVTDQKVRCTYC
jgi:hypothetical protein